MKDTILKLIAVALTGAVFAIAKHFNLDDTAAGALSASVVGAFASGTLHTTPGK